MNRDINQMIPVDKFAELKGIEPSKVVDMVRDGFYIGRIIDGNWYVAREEVSRLDESTNKSTPSESPYPLFSRKQLAWMGLIFGMITIILLNVDFGYYSMVDKMSHELFSYRETEASVWGINLALTANVWFLRVHLGAVFAFFIGVILNITAVFARKV